MNKRKGIVLVVSLVVLAIMLVLTGVYFSSLLGEKRAADTEKFNFQSLDLAEAGANQAVAELRKRVRTDLNNALRNETRSSVLVAYVAGNNSIGLLRDYAFTAGNNQFVIAGNLATLAVAPISLNSGVQGNYSTTITIQGNGNPTNPRPDVYVFPYKYYIDATGAVTKSFPAVQKSVRLGNGSFTITVRRDNFAKFALFTAHHKTPSGTTVWFTANTNFTGPVSTNDRLSFALNPSAGFTEEVTQHKETARYYNNNDSVLLDADYNSYIDPNTGQEVIVDLPSFAKGFERGYEIVNLESSVSQADLKKEALGTFSEPGSSGIYIPNDGTTVTGGVFIKSNRGDIGVAMSVDGSGNAVYTLTRGSTDTTVMTVNYATRQTSVTTGGSTVTYSGLPDGTKEEGVLIYANNDISSFSGTVQKDSSVTVSSEKDIVITNHVQYQNYNAGPPINATGYNNVLGVLAWGGNVRIGSTAPSNLNVHAVVMAPHGVFTVDDYDRGSSRGLVNLLGGAITDFYGPFGTFGGNTPTGYGRNFVYDARMLAGMTPPYFPYLSNFTSSDDGGLDNVLTWQDKG